LSIFPMDGLTPGYDMVKEHVNRDTKFNV
jgi:hypothetical protein